MEQLSVQISLVHGAMNSWELRKLFKSTSKIHGLIFFIAKFCFSQIVFNLFNFFFTKLLFNIAILFAIKRKQDET